MYNYYNVYRFFKKNFPLKWQLVFFHQDYVHLIVPVYDVVKDFVRGVINFDETHIRFVSFVDLNFVLAL